MFGQYEFFDVADWGSYDFFDYGIADYGLTDYGLTWDMPDYSGAIADVEIPTFTYDLPSEARFTEIYQAQQEAVQASVQGGGGLLDAFKSILGVASPITTAIMKGKQEEQSGQQQTSTGQQRTSTLQTSSGTSPITASIGASIGGAISSLASSPLLLMALGLGGFMLLRKGKK